MKKVNFVVVGVFLIIIISAVYFLKNNNSNNSQDVKDTEKVSDLKVDVSKDSVLYFNPSEKLVSVGENFALEAMIDPGENNINAVTLHFIFDQTKIRLDSIIPSENFSLVLSKSIIDNNDGTASIDVAVPVENESIFTTSKMVTLNFNALASTLKSPVSYVPASQVAADGEADSVVKSRDKAFVTVK